MKELENIIPGLEIQEETEHWNLKNLWNDQTFMIRLNRAENHDYLKDIRFPAELSAILHNSKSELEFIMEPASNTYLDAMSNFTFHFGGKEFKCYYKEPSEVLYKIAAGFRELEESSSTDYRNLREIRDYLRMSDLPKYVQKYFENRTPVSFFIAGDFSILNEDFREFSTLFNFYVKYYNRKSPTIIIHEEKSEKESYNIPCFMDTIDFPETLTFKKIDPVLLDMFQIATQTGNVRLKYLFYFQILEYCSYYYLNDQLSKQLRDVIMRPDLLNNTAQYSKLIIDQFKDHFKHNDDSMKLEKTIEDYCCFDDIKNELEKNLEFFTSSIEFDGGFKLDGLLNDEGCLEKPPKQIMRNVKNNIEKIRNTLVHLRESRENKVILPTPKNNHLLIPYLFVVRRLAEKVAIMHGN